MKKFFILCLMALAVCVNANADKVVGHYHQGSTEYIVQAGHYHQGSTEYIVQATYKNDLEVFIQVDGGHKSDMVFICIYGIENIQNFIDALNVCKTKYIEWSEVAKSNNITDFRKPINVKFPDVQIGWFGNETYLSHKHDFIKPTFSVGENINFVVIAGKAKHWNNDYIDTNFYMILTQNDIDELVNALNVDNIYSIFSQETKTDALFQ